ncbi:MAG: 6-phosphogluconolactonase [Thermoproteota archaeon]
MSELLCQTNMKRELPPDFEELITRITVARDEKRMGELAAKAILSDIEETIRDRNRAVVLFASAPSQHSTWKAMIDLVKKNEFRRANVKKILAFHMDEYLGLEPDAPQLFGKVLRKMLFEPFGIREENIHYFNDRICFDTAIKLRKALANNESDQIINQLSRQLEEEADRHIDEIVSEFHNCGGVFDIVVGGIGKHPHLAFNDAPYAKFNDPKIVKVVRISDISRQQQVDDGEFSRLEDVPTHALTFTLPPIFSSRKIHIIVPRAFKANAVKQTLDGLISEKVPASGLRQPSVLPKVKFYLDNDSAMLSNVAQEVVRRKGYS